MHKQRRLYTTRSFSSDCHYCTSDDNPVTCDEISQRTGSRRGDIESLKISDIDFEKNCICTKSNGKCQIYLYPDGSSILCRK